MASKKWKNIVLASGHKTKVDAEDYCFLNRFRWHKSKFGHVSRTVTVNGKTKLISMSRLIVGIHPLDTLEIDHINHNPLDNRKCNLRKATHQQNGFNCRKYSNKKRTSKYKGIYWDSFAKSWKAKTRFSGKDYHIGRFDSEIEAAKAYDKVISKLHGEFACLNFKRERPR